MCVLFSSGNWFFGSRALIESAHKKDNRGPNSVVKLDDLLCRFVINWDRMYCSFHYYHELYFPNKS